ncbi:MAG: hypothetical protein JXL80_06340 [Planctomycetes bacterium]|nr:hypothetical protein [Planctomycetota bacterium]
MAETHESKKPETTAAQASSRRPSRMIIGANVLVASVLMVGLVVAVNFIAWWATKEFHLTKDMTRQGLHSFSGRTTKVLNKIEDPVRMTSLFYAAEKDEEAALRKRRVEELLELYEASGRNVTVESIDPVEDYAKLTEMGKRIAKLHTEETAPYADVIKRYLEFNKMLLALMQSEKALFEKAAADPAVTGDLRQFVGLVAQKLGEQHDGLKNIADEIRADVGRWIGEANADVQADDSQWRDMGIPRYSDATGQIGGVVNAMSMLLNAIVQGTAQQKQVAGAKLPDAARHVFDGIEDRYQDVLKQLVELATSLNALEPLALDDFRNRIRPNTIIVEAPGKARVVEFDEIWPAMRGGEQEQMDDQEQRSFSGEDAVTSALIRLTRKTKTAAIFVIHGGMPIGEHLGAYTEFASRLSRNNFEIVNWDLTRDEKPPEVEGCDKRVFILMPPEQQQQQRMMGMPQPPPARPEDYEPVRKYIESGEAVMAFARVSPQDNPMMGGVGVPYLGLLKSYGVKVRIDASAAMALPEERADGKQAAIPLLATTSYPSDTNRNSTNPIITPLQGLLSYWPAAGVIELEVPEAPVAGLRIEPLVEAPKGEKNWGETDLMTINNGIGQFDPGVDVAPPFAVAVACERPFGTKAGTAADGAPGTEAREGRLVVFGTDVAAMDNLMKPHLSMSNAGLQWVDFPGNGELIVNAMLWLSGQEDMIAVSSTAMQYSRIGDLGNGKGTLVRWLLWGGLPLAVILIGIVVYSVRMRTK